jgi:membrane protein YqaA with SNARE-associated domain
VEPNGQVSVIEEAPPTEEAMGIPDTPTYDRLSAKVWVMAILMVLIGIITAGLMTREISSESYLYLIFYSIPANTAISIFPHEPVLIYFGKVGSIWWAAGAAAIGTVIAGYMDHTVFVPVLNLRNLNDFKKKRLYRRSIQYFMRWPFATLFVTGFTPIPFWPFKLLTFSIHYPLWKYLVALTAARYPRYLLLAWLGAAFEIPNWVIIGSFLVVILLYLVNLVPGLIRRWRRKQG